MQGQWVTCRAPYLSLEDHTEKELLIATTELRRQARRDGARADLSAERLATHMSKAVSHEALLRQRLRDLEQKKVLALIAGQSGHAQTSGNNPPSPVGPPEAVKAVSKLTALSTPVDLSRLQAIEETIRNGISSGPSLASEEKKPCSLRSRLRIANSKPFMSEFGAPFVNQQVSPLSWFMVRQELGRPA